MVKVNLANVGSGFEAMPNGRYRAYFADFKVGTSQAGNPKVNMEFHIDKEEHPDYANRRVWDNSVTITIPSLWKLKKILLALGYSRESMEDGEGIDPSKAKTEALVAAAVEMLNEVKGAPVWLTLSVDSYTKTLPDGQEVEEQTNRVQEYTSVNEYAGVA